tara:strand:- start:8288 stop:8578 length:291 start_codon:yes stop_codon:yes gene_type:complete
MSKEMCKCCTCGYQWKQGTDGHHSCVDNLLKKIAKLEETSQMKSWAFKRPFCNPNAGIIQAKTGEEAIKLIHRAYGFTSNVSVYCAETNENIVDNT